MRAMHIYVYLDIHVYHAHLKLHFKHRHWIEMRIYAHDTDFYLMMNICASCKLKVNLI